MSDWNYARDTEVIVQYHGEHIARGRIVALERRQDGTPVYRVQVAPMGAEPEVLTIEEWQIVWPR